MPILMLFVLYLIKTLGAGDIKVFSIIGGFFGIHFIFKVIILSFILGAVLAIIHIIRYKNLINRLQHLAYYISQTVRNKKISTYYSVEKDGTNGVIHFSVAIAAATVILLFCRSIHYTLL